jgi:hypothetical protein
LPTLRRVSRSGHATGPGPRNWYHRMGKTCFSTRPSQPAGNNAPAFAFGSGSPLDRHLVAPSHGKVACQNRFHSHAGPTCRVAQDEFRAPPPRECQTLPIRSPANLVPTFIVRSNRGFGEGSQAAVSRSATPLKRKHRPRCSLARVVGLVAARQNDRSTPEGLMPARSHYSG